MWPGFSTDPMTFAPGHTRSKPYLFDEAGIIAFATLAGDENPLHHDAALASQTRFKGLIASGAHMAAVLMGFGASMISAAHDAVGLEFTYKFERAIPADTATILTYTITDAQPHAKLGGTLLTFSGAITDAAGRRFVTSHGTAVVWDKPAGVS
jgi:3-hydroxybutyryl-CoA dehydratase